jgi:phosphoheptose isomerase
MNRSTHTGRLADMLSRADMQWQLAADWGRELAERLTADGRLLVAGNGGSAAQAQHLSAEIVGRYARDRRPFSALSLHTDTSAITAIVNDYGAEEMFARQVQAHGRPGDLCLLMSTSGASPNLLRAAERARRIGLTVWAMTGKSPNPLATLADEAMCFDTSSAPTVQELHLVALHLICEELDDALDQAALAIQGALR